MAGEAKLKIHSMIERSAANGPGERFTLWVQGCATRCPDCFNPELVPLTGGEVFTSDSLAERVLSTEGIEGLTVSGGEPLLQVEGLVELLKPVRAGGLSTLVFTGYTREELDLDPKFAEFLTVCDALIAGPYLREMHCGQGLISSTNQQIVLLSERYRLDDFRGIPEAEVHVDPTGTLTMTGVDTGGIFLTERKGKNDGR